MKIAITGASGYVGSCIADGFRRHGHEVLALSRRPCPDPWFPYSMGDDPAKLPWEGVDALVHAAYDFTPNTWPEFLDKNVHPGIALLQAAHRAGVSRLIFISSMSCFEGCRSNYGRAKLMIEQEALKLGATVIRPGLVWGDRSGGVMGSLENLVQKVPVIPFLCGGKNSNQLLIHETDLSDALVSIAGARPVDSGAVVSIANPSPVSLLTILKSIATRSRRKRVYIPIPWQIAMAGLCSLEQMGVRPPFRSDSLTGLIHGNPNPEIPAPPPGITFRPFR